MRLRVFLPALILLGSLPSHQRAMAESADEPGSLLVERLLVFATAYSDIRYFHPSSLSDGLDWHRFLVDQVIRLRTGNMPIRDFLADAFRPIAPTVVFCPAEQSDCQDVASSASSHYRIDSLELTFLGREYGAQIERQTQVLPAAEITADVLLPYQGQIGDITYRVPIAVAANEQGVTADANSLAQNANKAYLRSIESVDSDGVNAPDRATVALIAAWAAARHFFPTDSGPTVDWAEVLRLGLAEAVSTRESDAALSTIFRMLGRIGDANGIVYDLRHRSYQWSIGQSALPLFYNGSEFFTTRSSSRLKPGTVIRTIDGKTPAQLLRPWDAQLADYPWMASTWHLSRVNGWGERKVRIKGQREGRQKSDWKSLPNFPPSYGNEVKSRGDGILYVDARIGAEWDYVSTKLSRMQDARLVLLDVRGGLGMPGLQNLLHHLPAPDEELAFHYSFRSWARPLEVAETRKVGWYRPGESLPTITTPFAIIVDQETHGEAERVAAEMLARGQATLIGGRTAGSPAYPLKMSLPGRLEVYFDSAPFFDRAGAGFNRVGLMPDVEAEPTLEAALANIDVELTAALRWAREQMANSELPGNTEGDD